MRKKGVLLLLIVLVLFLVLSLLLTNGWLERQMESVGSSLVGAKVEFDGVRFSVFGLKTKWDRLQVTDPKNTWYNLFETGKVEFDLDLEPLLYKKVIIENLELDSLRFHSRRESDGKLPAEPETAKKTPAFIQMLQKNLEKETRQMPVFNLSKYSRKINVDSLWQMVKLSSPRKIDSLKNDYAQKYTTWETRIAGLPGERELQEIQQQIESIKPDQVKTVKDLQVTLSRVKRLYKTTDSLKNTLKQVKTDFQNDMKKLHTNRQVVSVWLQDDYRRVLSLAQLPEISVRNVAKVLFGQRIINFIETISGYIGTARYYAAKFDSGEPKKESPPRFKGQDIHFGSRTRWPDFWAKQIALSGDLPNRLHIAGKIENIVSQQKLINRPTTIAISGKRKDNVRLKLSGILDYREKTKQEDITLHLVNLPLSNVRLTNFALLPYAIRKGAAEVKMKLRFEGNTFLSDLNFTGKNVQFDLSAEPETKLSPRLVSLSQSIARSIDQIQFSAHTEQTDGKFVFSMKSNLDNLVMDKMKDVFAGEVSKAHNELEQRVQNEVIKYRQKLDRLIAQKEQALQKKIARVEEQLDGQRKKVEALRKEIENKINEKKKAAQKKVEEEAKKKLKNIFK